MRSRQGVVVGLISAVMLAVLLPAAAPAVAADPLTVENITNAELLPETDAGPPLGWYWLGWDTGGGTAVARVVVDDSEPGQHDGSLHVATPGSTDRVQVRQVPPPNRTDGPTLQDLTVGGFDVRPITGPAPELIVKVDCNAGASSSPEAAFTLTYAGVVPSDGTWHHVDAVDGGDALWWSDATMNADGTKESATQLPTAGGLKGGPGSPHPLSEYARVCTDSLVRSYGVRQSAEGADGYVDNVRLGTRSTNFWVPALTRLAGADRRTTACEAARHQFTNTLDYSDGYWWNPAAVRDHPKAVVVVNEDSYPDALAAGPLANALHGALLLSNGRDKAPCMPDLGIEKVDTVYLVGGTAVLSRSVEVAYQRAGVSRIHRIGGTDRFDTAVQVTRTIDGLRRSGSTETVFLASGTDFADALSAGAPAGQLDGAVLLTAGTRMAAATSAYLSEHSSAAVFAIGGPAAVAADLPTGNEIVGANRYETATMVADRFFPVPTSAAFASGVRFPDGLAAAAYGGHVGAPVILVAPDAVPNAVFDYVRQHRHTLRGSVLLGGDAAVHWYTADMLIRRLTPPRTATGGLSVH